MLITESSYFNVNNDRNKVVKTLAGSVLRTTAMVFLGNTIQNIRGYSLPPGLRLGSLLLVIHMLLFLSGQQAVYPFNL